MTDDLTADDLAFPTFTPGQLDAACTRIIELGRRAEARLLATRSPDDGVVARFLRLALAEFDGIASLGGTTHKLETLVATIGRKAVDESPDAPPRLTFEELADVGGFLKGFRGAQGMTYLDAWGRGAAEPTAPPPKG